MVNLNVMDFSKGSEWDGLWSERNEWYNWCKPITNKGHA